MIFRAKLSGTPSKGHPGKQDLLEASEWPALFSCSVENEHTYLRPLKSLSGASDSLSGPLGGRFRDPELLKRGVELRGL